MSIEMIHGVISSSGGTAPASTDVPGVLIAVGLLIAAVIVLAIVLLAMRRRLLASSRVDDGMGLFEELRRLHASGELSDEEFERARERMIARLKGEAPRSSSDRPRAESGKG